jgi:hypothetical protein
MINPCNDCQMKGRISSPCISIFLQMKAKYKGKCIFQHKIGED